MPRASLPVLGPDIPQSGGAVSRWVGRLGLATLGWHVTGDMPNLRKFVLIVAPHTSNWDFPVGMSAKLALGLSAIWLGKHTLFRFPFGIILRALGGIPVYRSASQDVVQQVTGEFAKSDRLVLAVAPEGTRKKVERWKTGFYHIARSAGIPIVPVALDWQQRAIRILPAFATTGNVDADIAELRGVFEGVKGRNR